MVVHVCYTKFYNSSDLETAEIERMLAEDEEELNQRRNNLSM